VGKYWWIEGRSIPRGQILGDGSALMGWDGCVGVGGAMMIVKIKE
jgi:hypothetical protein